MAAAVGWNAALPRLPATRIAPIRRTSSAIGPYSYCSACSTSSFAARRAGRIAATASSLYARNLFAFLETLVDKAGKKLAINRDDELVKATLLTIDGKVVHPAFVRKEGG